MKSSKAFAADQKRFKLSPLQLLIAVVVLTISIFVGVGCHIWNLYQNQKTILRRDFQLEALSGTIIHLDEVLTMSATMSAATGELRWEKRYHQFELELDAAIQKVKKLSHVFPLKEAIGRVDSANVQLVKMEHQAFGLVQQKRSKEASLFLSGTEYTKQKEIYMQGIQTVLQTVQKDIQDSLRSLQQWAFFTAIISAYLIVVLGVIWFLVVRRMRTYINNLQLLEKTLRKEKELAQKYLDVEGVMVVAIDAEERVGLINQKGADLLGYSEEEIIGKKWFDHFTPERTREAARSTFHRILRGEFGLFGYYENFVLTKSGKERLIGWSNVILRDEEGKITGTISSGEDITDRKEAEKELHRAKEEWEKTFDTVPDLVAILDKNQRFVRVNRAMAEKLKRSSEECIGLHCYETIHGANMPPDFCPHTKLMHEGLQGTVEIFEKHLGGEYLITHSPFYDVHGQIIASVLVAHDITERKRAEEALRREKEFNQALLENALDGVVACDAEGKLTLFNHAAREWHGMDALKLPPEKWAEHYNLYHFDGITPLSTHEIPLARAFQGETIRDFGMTIRAKGQPVRFIHASGAPFFDKDGKKLGAVAVMRDVTASMYADQKISASENRYRRLFESAKDGILILDAETGAVVDSNAFLQTLLGYSYEELIGKKLWEIGVFKDAALSKQAFTELQTQEYIRYEDLPLLTKTGDEISVEFVSNVYLVNEKKVIQCNIRDITERKRAELRLKRLNRSLEMLRRCNEALVRISSEAALLNAICQIIVESGGYRMAWVGFAEHDLAKTIQPAAFAGHDAGYLRTIKISWGEDDFGRTPSGLAIKTGQPTVIHNFQDEQSFHPWKAEALKRGYVSVMALPLIHAQETLGALAIYAGEADAFDENETNLLKELASDLAYGIGTSRLRSEHQVFVEALRRSGQHLAAILSHVSAAIFETDREGNYLFVNEHWSHLTGFQSRDVAGQGWLNSVHPDDRERVASDWKSAFQKGEAFNFQYRMLRADGKTISISLAMKPNHNDRKEIMSHIGTITEIAHT